MKKKILIALMSVLFIISLTSAFAQECTYSVLFDIAGSDVTVGSESPLALWNDISIEFLGMSIDPYTGEMVLGVNIAGTYYEMMAGDWVEVNNVPIYLMGGGEDCPCTESWTCGSWSSCTNAQQTRTCTDANDCGTTTSMPATTQSCTTIYCGNGVCDSTTNNENCNSCPQDCKTCSCTESWTCGSWSTCANNQQTRICTDSKNCGTTANKPATTQTCTSTCTESWTCGSWSSCINGQQTRTCADAKNCGTTANKPTLTQSCTSTCSEDWLCNDWSSCANNKQIRTCTEKNNCVTTINKPVESKECSCIQKWECEITPSTCPLDGLQSKVCKDVACGSEDTREALKCVYQGETNKIEECNGCLLDSACLQFGFRREGKYCDVTKNFYPQKNDGEVCSNGFECVTNTCSNGVCVNLEKELKDSISFLKKIWCKLIHPFDDEVYNSCLAD